MHNTFFIHRDSLRIAPLFQYPSYHSLRYAWSNIQQPKFTKRTLHPDPQTPKCKTNALNPNTSNFFLNGSWLRASSPTCAPRGCCVLALRAGLRPSSLYVRAWLRATSPTCAPRCCCVLAPCTCVRACLLPPCTCASGCVLAPCTCAPGCVLLAPCTCAPAWLRVSSPTCAPRCCCVLALRAGLRASSLYVRAWLRAPSFPTCAPCCCCCVLTPCTCAPGCMLAPPRARLVAAASWLCALACDLAPCACTPGYPQVLGDVPEHLGISPSARGYPPSVQGHHQVLGDIPKCSGISPSARGYPQVLGDIPKCSGISPSARGYPQVFGGDRGYPPSVRGYLQVLGDIPDCSGVSPSARGYPRN
jgi:hypothetical protein